MDDADVTYIYEPLPHEVQNSIDPLLLGRDPFVKTFLRSVLPLSDQDGIKETEKKKFHLVRLGRPRRLRNKRSGKGSLSLCERRRLGLYQLRRHGSLYSDALPLHTLWKQYIDSVLSLNDLKDNNFSAHPSDRQWEQVSLALYRADYHGAHLEVTHSKCSSLVGVKGIVLMDTKHTFKVIGCDNIVRTIPKVPCVFKLKLADYCLTLYGKHFCVRPAERSSKKLKTYSVSIL